VDAVVPALISPLEMVGGILGRACRFLAIINGVMQLEEDSVFLSLPSKTCSPVSKCGPLMV
jgi:hypothetical protein